mmetsp:Transcript_29294/g.60915  ORF Transcript_29294/g.60915 Transcript_29294/m.60915 type:complete len:227 (+) Transcript_29294:176-856(+)
MSKCGFRLDTCTHCETTPCFSMAVTLMTPERPALASMCARLLFTEVRVMGLLSERNPSMAARNAPTSMGSPRAVPVPWHSMMVRSEGKIPASCMLALVNSLCEGPLGAVMLALRPSWLMALPPMVDHGSFDNSLPWKQRWAELQPSPFAKPSEAKSKVKQRPFFESIPMAQRPGHSLGSIWLLTAQTRFTLSPRRICKSLSAVQVATNDDEHAVSTRVTGPRVPRN